MRANRIIGTKDGVCVGGGGGEIDRLRERERERDRERERERKDSFIYPCLRNKK